MDKRFNKLVKQVLNIVKEQRRTLPEYSVFGDNNWRSLDIEIKLLSDYLQGNSINWFDPKNYEDDNDMQNSIACYAWLNGKDSTYGEDCLG